MFIGMVLATVLIGQDSVQTCGMEFGRWVCRTTDNRPPAQASVTDNMSRTFDMLSRMTPRAPERREEPQAAPAYRANSALRQTVVTLILQGDCQGAVAAALRGGDLALATEARQFCAISPQGGSTPSQPGN